MLEFPKAKTTEEKLLFIYGFIGTMPIVEVLGFTGLTWLTLLMIGYLFFNGIKCKIKKATLPFIVFTLLTFVSSFICLVSGMDRMWKTIQIPNMIWQACFLIIFLNYYNRKGMQKCLFYIKGVYWASFAHAIWGILQLLIYEIAHVSINKVIFFDLMHVQMAEYVQMRGNGNSIAMTGFCWNAGNFAPLLVIGYVFSPSIYLKMLFAAVSILSGSRTGIIGIITCVVVEVFFRLSKRHKKIKRTYIVGGGVILLIAIVTICSNSKLMDSISHRIQEMMGTLSLDYLHTQSSSTVHARYWTSVPIVTQWNGVLNNLFGYGNGCSGYPFAILYGQYDDHNWVVECDYINNLWSFGYIGFALWYSWYGNHVFKGKKLDKKFLVLFLGLLVEGITYNVTFNWCFLFLLFVFIEIDYSNDFISGNDVLITGEKKRAIIRNY